MSQPVSDAQPKDDPTTGLVILPTNRSATWKQVVEAVRQLQTRVYGMSSAGTNAQKIAALQKQVDELAAQVQAGQTDDATKLGQLQSSYQQLAAAVTALDQATAQALAGKAGSSHSHPYAGATHSHALTVRTAVADVPLLNLQDTATVQVTLSPAMPAGYTAQAVPVIGSPTVQSVTVKSSTRVDVVVKHTGTGAIVGARLLVIATHIGAAT